MVPFQKAAKATGLHQKIHSINTQPSSCPPSPTGARCARGSLWHGKLPFLLPGDAENKVFVEEFRNAYKRDPKIGALYGYTTAIFLEKGFVKAGKVDKEKLIDAWKAW